MDYSMEDSGCNKLHDAGPFSSLSSEGSGIQKIIPSDFKVSAVKAFTFYFIFIGTAFYLFFLEP